MKDILTDPIVFGCICAIVAVASVSIGMAFGARNHEKRWARRVELLSALVSGEKAGRDVAKIYEASTGRGISYVTLYYEFACMAKDGYVTTREDFDPDGRRRFFTLTDLGRKAIEVGAVRRRSVAERTK